MPGVAGGKIVRVRGRVFAVEACFVASGLTGMERNGIITETNCVSMYH